MPPARVRVHAGRTLMAAWLWLGACAGPTLQPTLEPTPVPRPPSADGPIPNLPPTPRQPIVPPALAALRGWLPLAATGVPLFLAEHPAWDGRGVLLGILDSGIDPGTPGLLTTSIGTPKLLDLRDFSGEGSIVLEELTPDGDSISVAGRVLRGFGRVRGIAAAGPWFAGILEERALGDPAAADLNDNGSDADSLIVVVARASDGWVLFADSDGDRSLADERPVHDYLVARETFGWHRAGEPPPTTLAVNLSERAGRPALELYFDNSSHGTHVAGIAAGFQIASVAGFHGVAPGAQLLGLKISRNDLGGITTTGSVMRAVDYAIRFARLRGLPLVLNMSFGVGNEQEGVARIDQLIDSVLTAYPNVIFVTSAGNDGPGLSTLGFPGSARRAITVGATDPWVLTEAALRGGQPSPDRLAFFSARGGELAKPDIVAPGTAFSTVPRWNMGDEFKGGTSMAAPHVAGLAALLLSAATEQHRTVTAEDLRRALIASAAPVVGGGPIDQGAGLPSLQYAWPILRGPQSPSEFVVAVVGGAGITAAFRVAPPVSDSIVKFSIRRSGGAGAVDVALESSVPWLRGPSSVRLTGPVDTIALVHLPPNGSGAWTGVVRATLAGVPGPVFSLVSTVVNPNATRAVPVRLAEKLEAGASRRAVFAVDAGRPFRVRSSTSIRTEKVLAALFQPGGAPIPGDGAIPGSADTLAAIHQVDGRDARPGYYEIVAVAGDGGASVAIAIDHSPISLATAPGRGDTVVAAITSLVDSSIAGRLRIGLAGLERSFELNGVGKAEVRNRFRLPSWVQRVVIDLELDPRQWPRFTDFGFALKRSDGRLIGKQPANYHRTRLDETLPSRPGEEEVVLLLAPGFAELESQEPWRARITLRLYAASPVGLPSNPAEEYLLPARSTREFRASVGEFPWPRPAGFAPFGVLVSEIAGLSWTWERSFTARNSP